MRVSISTMIWKRHDVFHVWATAWTRLINSFPEIDFDVVISGSEGALSRNLVESYGFHYIEVSNRPIGRKSNARLQYAQQFAPDYALTCGSDDVMCNKTFEFYLEKIQEGFEEIAPMQIYYWNVETKELAYSLGYHCSRKGEPIAPFRMVKSTILDQLSWEPWYDKEYMSLDSWYRDCLEMIPHKKLYYYPRKEGLFILDIKSKSSKTKFIWHSFWEKVPAEELDKLPERDLIHKL